MKTRVPEEEFVLRARQNFLEMWDNSLGLNFGAAGEVAQQLPLMARQAGPRSLDGGGSRLAVKLPYRLFVAAGRLSQGAGRVEGKTLPAEGLDDPRPQSGGAAVESPPGRASNRGSVTPVLLHDCNKLQVADRAQAILRAREAESGLDRG